MRSTGWGTLLALTTSATLGWAAPASAHPVTADGLATEWATRVAASPNLGIVARNAAGAGEHVWLDVAADTRTDLATPESEADILEVRTTGDRTSLAFLIRLAAAAPPAMNPVQIQIAIDTDRVAGSGQTFFAGFADTSVTSGARWERLVQTQLSSGGCRVLDTTFASVGAATIARGADSVGSFVEVVVPWATLGLSGPPTSPLRFTIASFRELASGDTMNIGGAAISNALDAVTEYGDPQAAGPFPNTFAEVSDQVVDYSADVWFAPDGEVYSPLLVTHFVSDAPGPNTEWVAIRNVSPSALSLVGFKLGDEETVDATGEYLGTFPITATLAAGASYIVAVSGTLYAAYYGEDPDAELAPTSATVADMTRDALWSGGGSAFALANGGDQILLVAPWSTILDVVTYGTGTYVGVNVLSPVPGANQVARRTVATSDTDDCAVDFAAAGSACASDASCSGGAACNSCVLNTCSPRPAGTACADGDVCNGAEVCSAAGACTAGAPLVCNDGNVCTTDACAPATGCTATPVSAGTSCADGNACNGAETCSAAGVCSSATPLACNDGNPCTTDACAPATGCTATPVSAGTSCADGNACNGAETCGAAGTCTAGTPLVCDDANVCTTDACAPATGCTATPVSSGTSCSDGDPCNGAETCNAAGTCVAGTPVSCVDAGTAIDAGSALDAGGGVDAGGAAIDAGGTDADAGGVDLDAGGMDVDAGGVDLDAGGMDVDAAVAPIDAAARDAATVDAAASSDAAARPPDSGVAVPRDDGGCSCRAARHQGSTRAALASLALLALIIMRRRRR